MPTIAIIDNEEDSRNVIQTLLEAEGHTVQEFQSGKDFLVTFTAGLFDLILMDLAMPDMDGYTLLKAVRSKDPSVPVMAVTAMAFAADREKAYAAGFSDFVTKPVRDFDTFFDLITKRLQTGSN
jgi:two-component system CheB/CheR fusion protein